MRQRRIAAATTVAVYLLASTGFGARGQGTANETQPQATSLNDVLQANPIKLFVTADAPSSDLPRVAGPLTIKEAVEVGLKNNLVYKQSQIDTEMARYRSRAALGRFGPNLSVNTFYSTSSLNQMLFFPNDGLATSTPMQPILKGSLLSVIFSGTQPIFTGGYLRGNLKAKRAEEKQSMASYQSERIATGLRVKKAYWDAVWSEAKLKVDSDYVKFKVRAAANMKARVDEGKVPRAELLREEAELARARLQLNQDYRDYNVALINLKAEMGINLGSVIDLAESLDYADNKGDLSTYLVQAGINRPEVSLAINKIDEMKGKQMMAKSAYSPHVELYGLGSNLTGNSPDGSASGRWGGFVGLLGHFTLYDSGQRSSDLKESNAAIRQAVIAKQQTQLKIAQDVSTAWVEVDLTKRNIELAKSEVTSAQEDYRLLHERYLIGKAIQLEEFDAAIKLFRARLGLQEAIYNYRLAQDRLTWATGNI